jgi:hypothetical protein
VKCIASWLGSPAASFKWDIISFNFGIHDCWCGPECVNATAYKSNLEYIYTAASAALAPGGKVVWTSTTPIAQNCSLHGPRGPCYGVQPACVANYNKIAFELLASKPDVLVNDVYNRVLDVCDLLLDFFSHLLCDTH